MFGIACAAGVVPAGFLAVMTVYFFDAPGSSSNPVTWALAAGFWAAPVVLAVSSKRAFDAFRTAELRHLVRASAMTLAVIAYIVCAWSLLEFACDGTFDCRGETLPP